MKHLVRSALIAIILISCQPHFADPETEDRVQLLEERIVKLEEQLRMLRTTSNTQSNANTKAHSDPSHRELPVISAGNAPRPRPSRSSGYSESRKSSQGSPSYSGRCQATTKKGTQCKRNSRSGGYCWQHGG